MAHRTYKGDFARLLMVVADGVLWVEDLIDGNPFKSVRGIRKELSELLWKTHMDLADWAMSIQQKCGDGPFIMTDLEDLISEEEAFAHRAQGKHPGTPKSD